jgi:hypothetical protein
VDRLNKKEKVIIGKSVMEEKRMEKSGYLWGN